MAGKKSVHIVPREDGWAVRRSNGERDSSHHRTQADAIEAGRTTARREQTELVIHDQKGRIRDSDSFGNDPNPPKDTKH